MVAATTYIHQKDKNYFIFKNTVTNKYIMLKLKKIILFQLPFTVIFF